MKEQASALPKERTDRRLTRTKRNSIEKAFDTEDKMGFLKKRPSLKAKEVQAHETHKEKKRISKPDSRRLWVTIAMLAISAAVIFLSMYVKIGVQGNMSDATAASSVTAATVMACIGTAVVSMLGLGLYLVFNESRVFKSTKNMLIILTLILLTTILNVLLSLISGGYFSAMLIAVILSAMLVKTGIGYPVAAVCALIAGMMAFPNEENWIPLALAFAELLGGYAALFSLKQKFGRMAPIISGIIGGSVSAIAFMFVQAIILNGFENFTKPLIWMLSSGVLCGIVATGLTPILEITFDVATDARLSELMNNNNPLIKRLMIEAPGTYHHSMLVAALAESAAEQVHANSLLCKAAGYYHDVGKLRSPMHFSENQRDFNIHDTLDPTESAERIIAHRKDSVTLLTKYKLPSDVIKLAGEHHGNSTVAFFYNKALRQAANPADVNEADFRYKASRPSSKEAGILMLADCCEAAVRSIKDPNAESIEAKVHEVVGNIWLKRDGQLSECPLTAKDVSIIEKSFISTLTAQYHERVEYPSLEEIEDAKK